MSFDWCCRCGRPDPPEGCTRPEHCHEGGDLQTEISVVIPAGTTYAWKSEIWDIFPWPDVSGYSYDYRGNTDLLGKYTVPILSGGFVPIVDRVCGIYGRWEGYPPVWLETVCCWDFHIVVFIECDWWNRCWYKVMLWFIKQEVYPPSGMLPLGTRWQYAWYGAGPFSPSEVTFPLNLDFVMGSSWHGWCTPCAYPYWKAIPPVATWPSSVLLGEQP